MHRIYRVLEMEPREEQETLIGEVNRRRGEMAVARQELDECGIPSEEDGITLTMSQRIRWQTWRSVMRLRLLERTSSYLRCRPMHEDRCLCERCVLLRDINLAIEAAASNNPNISLPG